MLAYAGVIELEMEECKYPYLLLMKKRYVARTWTMGDGGTCKPGKKIDYKGIELKRRDNAPVVKQVQLRVLLTLFAQELFDEDESGVSQWVEYVARQTNQAAEEQRVRDEALATARAEASTSAVDEMVEEDEAAGIEPDWDFLASVARANSAPAAGLPNDTREEVEAAEAAFVAVDEAVPAPDEAQPQERGKTMREYIQEAPERAMQVLREELQNLVEAKLPLESYVLSKTLKREYKNDAQAHVNVVKLKNQRNPGSGDAVGSRVRFYYRQKTAAEARLPKSQDKVSNRAEDPEWGKRYQTPPDRLKYLTDVRHAIESLFTSIQDARVPEMFDSSEHAIYRQINKQSDITSFFSTAPSGASSSSSALASTTPGASFRPLSSSGKRPMMASLPRARGRGRGAARR